MIRQRTLRNPVKASGAGLETGRTIQLSISPAKPNTGIRFVRRDLFPAVEIEAVLRNLLPFGSSTTTIAKHDVTVESIDRLMAAFAGMGVDNAVVEVSAGEIPMLDGSASPWVFLLESAGLVEQIAPKRFIRILDSIELSNETSGVYASLKPYHDFSMVYSYPGITNGPEYTSIEFSRTAFLKDLSRARRASFSSGHEGSIIGETSGDSDSLRFPDEFLKSRILDTLGDFYLCGYNLIGTFIGSRSGHEVNQQLLRRMAASLASWEYVTFASASALPMGYREDFDDSATSEDLDTGSAVS